MGVYVELTNPVHGGEGWELGEVLWSPNKSSWNIMQDPKPGDFIIHSVKGSKLGKNHRFWGISVVRKTYSITNIAPPIPSTWSGHDEYYRIPLSGFIEFDEKKPIENFLSDYYDKITALGKQKSFYTENTTEYKTAQKYLARVSDELFELLKDFLNIDLDLVNLGKNESSRIGDEETSYTRDEHGQPSRVLSTVNRIIRDTKIVKELKKEYNDKCQICGKQIKLPSGKKYSEGHHLKKLGGIHQGPDVKSNIIILCPNHHTEFDYGSIAINPESGLIVHIERENEFNGKELSYHRADLNSDFLMYHYVEIFKNKFSGM